jgi:hypothetical protein
VRIGDQFPFGVVESFPFGVIIVTFLFGIIVVMGLTLGMAVSMVAVVPCTHQRTVTAAS